MENLSCCLVISLDGLLLSAIKKMHPISSFSSRHWLFKMKQKGRNSLNFFKEILVVPQRMEIPLLYHAAYTALFSGCRVGSCWIILPIQVWKRHMLFSLVVLKNYFWFFFLNVNFFCGLILLSLNNSSLAFYWEVLSSKFRLECYSLS